MTTTAPPPGVLTGKPSLPGCRLAVPGFYHLNMLPAVAANRWLTPDEQRHDGDLVIGETEAHGPISVHYDTVAQWNSHVLAATIVRDWFLEARL